MPGDGRCLIIPDREIAWANQKGSIFWCNADRGSRGEGGEGFRLCRFDSRTEGGALGWGFLWRGVRPLRFNARLRRILGVNVWCW